MRSHEILGIPSLDTLNRMNDAAIRKAHADKLSELDAINVIDLEEYNRRKFELDTALLELQTSAKRHAYIQDLTQALPAMTSTKTKDGVATIFSNASPEEIDRTVKAYHSYIDDKITQLDNSDPNYQEKKAELENHKGTAAPKEEKHSSFEQFTESEYYQSLPANKRTTYSADNYPKKTVMITLTFDSIEAALTFAKTNMGIETARDLAQQFQDKGHAIKPEALEELQRGEVLQQRPHYKR